MSNSLVTVATFSQPFEGHLVRARLESEGIPCFLADAHTISAKHVSILLLGILLPFLSRRWLCRGCGRSWKMKLFR